ncbi:hypothetical protein DRN79_05195 [Methanosarcinales archaeon]|nr:MAG: hypothetical protein DRN79_05195 [Methanosarcinales archaeon]
MIEILSHKPLAAHALRSFRDLIRKAKEGERQEMLAALVIGFLSDSVEDEKLRESLRVTAMEHIEEIARKIREEEKKEEDEEEEEKEKEKEKEKKKKTRAVIY